MGNYRAIAQGIMEELETLMGGMNRKGMEQGELYSPEVHAIAQGIKEELANSAQFPALRFPLQRARL
jgi:hypothetical protein